MEEISDFKPEELKKQLKPIGDESSINYS